jgi:hypothetical protein
VEKETTQKVVLIKFKNLKIEKLKNYAKKTFTNLDSIQCILQIKNTFLNIKLFLYFSSL